MEHNNNDQERLVTIGGTFDILHPGHKDYIRLAFEYADRVLIYLSSDEYCKDRKGHELRPRFFRPKVRPYDDRVKDLVEFLGEIKCQDRYQINCLNKKEDLVNDYLNNPDLREKIYMAIVSPEYYELFQALNEERKKRGLENFLILVKERAYYAENDKIKDYSSSKIHKHVKARTNRAEKIDLLTSDDEIYAL
jgi:cytidyltransferase-like protein